MITGLKIPKGVSVNLEDGTKVDVKVGATLPDAVADVKPIMQIIRNRTDSISFNSKTDFILAFRVRKIITVNGKVQHKLSLNGTSMLDGDAEEVKRVGKGTLGDDYSPEEARNEAEEEEFDVMIFKDQADDYGDEFDWIVADVAA